MTDREAMKLALDALEEARTHTDSMEKWRRHHNAMDALSQALEQPVSFYVYEWVNPSDGIVFRSFRHDEHHMGREPDRTIAVPAPHTCAAPDLLEALQYAIKHVPELASVPGIAAAIAKARGE